STNKQGPASGAFPYAGPLFLFVVLAVVLDGCCGAAVGRHILLKVGELLLGRPTADQDQAGVVAAAFPRGAAGAAFALAAGRAFGRRDAPSLAAAPLPRAAGGLARRRLGPGGLGRLVFAGIAAALFAFGGRLRGAAVPAGPLGGLLALGLAAGLAVRLGGPLLVGRSRHRLGGQDGGLRAGQKVGVEFRHLLRLPSLCGTGPAIPAAAPGTAALLPALAGGALFGFVHDGLLFLVVYLHRLHLPHRSEEHTSELQSRFDLVCRLL